MTGETTAGVSGRELLIRGSNQRTLAIFAVVKQILSLVGRAMYRLMGWHFEPLPSYFGEKHVIIGFPHTSNMDTVRAFTGFRIVKKTGHLMIKKLCRSRLYGRKAAA